MSDSPSRHNLIDIASIVFGVDLQQSSYSWPAWVLVTASVILVSGFISAAAVTAAWWMSVLIWISFGAAASALM